MSNDMAEVSTGRTVSSTKKVLLYIEMDELHRLLRKTFGESFIRFDPNDLANVLIDGLKDLHDDWDDVELAGIRIYISHPDDEVNPRQSKFWNGVARFWNRNLGIPVISRPLESIRAMIIPENPEEKEYQKWVMGFAYSAAKVKFHLVADVIEDVLLNKGDVVVLVSRDFSYESLGEKIREISTADDRWIKIISAFPYKEVEGQPNHFRGIPKTDWFHITEDMYSKFKQDAPERDSSVD